MVTCRYNGQCVRNSILHFNFLTHETNKTVVADVELSFYFVVNLLRLKCI